MNDRLRTTSNFVVKKQMPIWVQIKLFNSLSKSNRPFGNNIKKFAF